MGAQNPKGKFSVKPMAGINVTTISGSALSEAYCPKVRFTAGMEMEYGVNDWLGLLLGVSYSQQGASVDGDFSSAIYGGYGGTMSYVGEYKVQLDGKINCDYVNVPLMAGIYIPQLPGLALKAGVQVGFLVNDFLDVTYIANGSSRLSLTSSGVTKSVDLGVPVGLSYERRNVVLDARYYFGLLRNDRTEHPESTRNRYLSITLGYRFHL